MLNENSENKDKVLHRLKIVRGHLNKVISMVENDEYCVDIIHQSQAIQNALLEVDHKILENHLNTCVVNDIKAGDSKTAISEIMKVIKKTAK
jgi:CsoR family transcriptional regulator, copper-sensing transcriptional repressor